MWRVEVVAVVIALTGGERAVDKVLCVSFSVLPAAMLYRLQPFFHQNQPNQSQIEAADTMLLLRNNQIHQKPLCLSFLMLRAAPLCRFQPILHRNQPSPLEIEGVDFVYASYHLFKVRFKSLW